MITMKQIKAKFTLKDDKTEEPTTYMGAGLNKCLTRKKTNAGP